MIDVPTRRKIRAAFGCSRMIVWMAVNFRRSTDLTRRIQKLAILEGGELIGCSAAEKIETMRSLGLNEKIAGTEQQKAFDNNEIYNETRAAGGRASC